ncbi:MAG: hypothetical protein QXD32_05235 [Nitrososphaerota archaeon]
MVFWAPRAPFRIAGGVWDELKGRYVGYLLGVWSEYAPNPKTSLLAKTSYSTLDTF